MSSDLLEALVELGLTSSEAKVYLAAARLGAATTTEIASTAEKERSNTHHLLQRLEQLGLVDATLDSPTKFKPVEPKYAIDHLFELQKLKLKRLEEMKSSTLTSLAPTPVRSLPDTETFSVVRGRVRTYLRVIDTLPSCRNEVSMLMSSNGLIRFSRFRNFVELMGLKAREGVKFKIVTEITKNNAEYARIMTEMAEVRHVRNQTTNASIYDKKLGSVALSINDALEEDASDHVALWSNGVSFVRMLASLFDSAWFLAAPAGPTMRSMGLRP